MPDRLVFTVIASDRPGLVRSLAAVISDHKGSWVQSEMARLGGEFAGIVAAEIPHDQQDAFKQACKGLEGDGLIVTFGKCLEETSENKLVGKLEVTGADRPGIVQQVSSLLSGLDISIDKLKTEIFSSSMAGQAMFKAKAKITASEQTQFDQLEKELETIGDDIIVEISL